MTSDETRHDENDPNIERLGVQKVVFKKDYSVRGEVTFDKVKKTYTVKNKDEKHTFPVSALSHMEMKSVRRR